MPILVASETPWNKSGTLILQKPKQRLNILTESHIKLDQIHHIRSNWLDPIFFTPGDSHSKGLLILLHLNFEGVTEVDTDPTRRSVVFKVTPSNYIVFCVYVSSGLSTREQLARGRLVEGLQNYMKNKNEGNENKIILGDFNCTMDKMENDGRNKTLYIDVVSIMLCQKSSWIMDKFFWGHRLQ